MSSGQIALAATLIIEGCKSSSSTRSSIITHALSQADFEELEVTVSGRINGTLEINAPAHNISASSINLEQPVDEHHHSHRLLLF